MATLSPPSELQILSEVINSEVGDLSASVAQALLQWRFTQSARDRMTELAERNQRGDLSESEREELDRYLRVGGLVNLVQAKARLSLQKSGTNGT
jgi:aminoglycoside phosphotransferase (APT) family kinase protein